MGSYIQIFRSYFVCLYIPCLNIIIRIIGTVNKGSLRFYFMKSSFMRFLYWHTWWWSNYRPKHVAHVWRHVFYLHFIGIIWILKKFLRLEKQTDLMHRQVAPFRRDKQTYLNSQTHYAHQAGQTDVLNRTDRLRPSAWQHRLQRTDTVCTLGVVSLRFVMLNATQSPKRSCEYKFGP